MKNYDDDYNDYDDYEELDDSKLDDDDDLGDFFDDDDDTSGPVTDEGALYFDMIQKLYATLEEYGENDPAFLQLQASLNKTAEGGEDVEDNTYYLEEAIAVAQQIKKYSKDSPRIKRIYDNFMVDIVRFTDESAPGHQGEYYL
jgi:hypothetical protein